MKQGSKGFLIFLLFAFLLLAHSASARFLLLKQGDQKVKANGFPHEGSLTDRKGEDLLNLMGSDECDDKDEECLRRRMVAEAHLDYIYTQHHKP